MRRDTGRSNDEQQKPTKPDSPPGHHGFAAYKVIFAFTCATHLLVLLPALLLAGLSGAIKPITSVLVGRFLTSFSKFSAGSIDDSELTRSTRDQVLALVGLGVATWIVRGVFCCAWITYGESQARSIRERLYSTLLTRDLQWFESQQSGVSTLLSRLHM